MSNHAGVKSVGGLSGAGGRRAGVPTQVRYAANRLDAAEEPVLLVLPFAIDNGKAHRSTGEVDERLLERRGAIDAIGPRAPCLLWCGRHFGRPFRCRGWIIAMSLAVTSSSRAENGVRPVGRSAKGR